MYPNIDSTPSHVQYHLRAYGESERVAPTLMHVEECEAHGFPRDWKAKVLFKTSTRMEALVYRGSSSVILVGGGVLKPCGAIAARGGTCTETTGPKGSCC